MIGYLTPNYALVSAFSSRPVCRTRGETIAVNRVFTTAPKLSDFFRDSEIVALKGELDRPISGLAIDSRRVMPGNLFFALPSQRADGATFIDEAVSRGAVAIVVQKMPSFPPSRVTLIRVADPRRSLAAVAQRFYKFPDRDLTVVGVTGTNGKTTVAHLLQHLLSGDQRVGLLGTINYDLGARTVPSYRTTPEALDVFGLMAQMRAAGCRQAIMEVSSHGLEQGHVCGLNFGAVVFTNLTRDPFDYHRTLDAYFEVKSRLFTGANGSTPKVAVVNLDDAYGEKLTHQLAAEVSSVRVVTFGENPAAAVRAEHIVLQPHRTTFRLVWPGGTMDLESPLVGHFHVSNLLAAIATAWGLGRDPVVFLAKLRACKGVPGRMERIDAGQSFNVLVDYAHTADALRNGLAMLRGITPGQLRVVFGCAGHRDRSKRAPMVRAAQETADRVYVTSDNPRTESLDQIFSDMRAGVTTPATIAWIADRRAAIAQAIAECRPGDCLVIAGKGHETVQECADTVFPFDDRQVAREFLAAQAVPT